MTTRPDARRRAAGLACVLLALGAGEAAGQPLAAPEGGGAPSSRLQLRECAVLEGEVPARCGTFRVPEDRGTRAGREIALEVVVVPAQGPSRAPDPVMVLAGGPGQVATELVEMVRRLAAVHRDRDLVFVNQRGTGAGALACPDARKDEEPAGYGAEHDAYWTACIRALGGPAALRHYTTSAAVDDFDEVRAALGYERVNLVGGSYGTRVAQAYLQRHPGRVRSAVLWAVAPAGYDIPVEGGLSVQAALGRLLDDCRADAACSAAFPRLGARLDNLLARLGEAPVRVRLPGGDSATVSIGRELFGQTLLALLFDAGHMRRIPALVDGVARGDWSRFAPVAAQVRAGMGEGPEALYLSVVCSEDVPLVRRERLAEFRGAYGALLRESAEELLHRCASWPRGEMAPELRAPARSTVPVLLLSGAADPATPPGDAERALRYLANARHVEVPATSHGPIFPGCVPEMVAAFVAAPDPARIDPACVREIRWAPFAIPGGAR
jgi:pimeloyl-ACP methyl ester carboxylesterase